MLKYIGKRLLFFIPTLFIITIFAFTLGVLSPGDPVNARLKGSQGSESGQLSEKQAGEKAYYEMSAKLGYNLPLFYFLPSTQATPDTLYKIVRKDQREVLKDLIGEYGNWPEIEQYYKSLKAFDIAAASISKDSTNFVELTTVKESIAELIRTSDKGKIEFYFDNIKKNINKTKEFKIDSVNTAEFTILSELSAPIEDAFTKYQLVKENATPIKNYIPAIHVFGIKNQYHKWIFGNVPFFGESKNPLNTAKGIVRGDFGESIKDGRPVSSKLKDAIFWTLVLNLIAVAISYFIAIPLGIFNAVKKDTKFDRVSTIVLFVLYSLPTFWIATLIVVFLTTNTYNFEVLGMTVNLDWFPTYGTGSQSLGPDASAFAKMIDSLPYLIAPLFCMTYGSFAYLSRQMRGGMLAVLRQDFIRTARAKGLAEKVVVLKHATRNSLIPIITIFAGLLPAMIGGSIVIEKIFQIPGMGNLAINSIFERDFPVMYTIVVLAAILTMLGVLISDILYAIADPRISYSKK